MIEIVNKQMCTGCCACMNVCPKQCITMEYDYEGFWYPKVDTTACDNCGLCEQVCPLLAGDSISIERLKSPEVLAVQNKNHAIRMDSTSGGVFSGLANRMFQMNGYVAGAVYTKDHTVCHVVTSEPRMLDSLRSSKYLQSYIGELYKEVLQLLENGKQALICGTPCQIAGLYHVLGKDYKGLITCDFICRGVNSPKAFLKYIEMLERKYGARAIKIKFKDKSHGWHRFSTRVDFANGKTYIKDRHRDSFMLGYLKYNCFSRPSCYSCQFKGIPRRADITLADFWGLNNIHPELDDDCGTSAVLINSEKGRDFFRSSGDVFFFQECTLREVAVGNSVLYQSLEQNPLRSQFFRDIDTMSFAKLSRKYFPVPGHIKRTVMPLFANVKGMVQRIIQGSWQFMGLSASAWWHFFYINMIRKNTHGNVFNSKIFLPTKYSRIVIDKSARIILNDIFILGIKENHKSTRETRFSLGRNSSLTINGCFSIGSGSDIRVFDNGELILNGGGCSAGVQIVCFKKITIGKGCAIARDVIIRDTDAHRLLNSNHMMTQEVFIGEHVWIGNRAIIMKGITINDGAVIAAGSIVTRDVPAKCLVAGVPARVIRENVEWQ